MNEDHTIHITSLSSTGEGIGALEGLKVFIEGALPGETVSVELTKRKKNYAKGRLLSILDASPERTEPICPLFGECGGCQVMHLQYPAQLALKRQRVLDALERIGGFKEPQVLSCLPSPTSIGYRNKIQLPVVWDQEKKTIGMFRKKSHEIIPIDRCFIQCSQGEEILTLISKRLTIPSVRYVLIRNAIFNDEALVVLVTDGRFPQEIQDFGKELLDAHPLIKGVVETVNTRRDNVILGKTFHTLAGRPYLIEQLLDKKFKLSAAAFFQVNPAQTEHLYEKALLLADIRSDETVLDAYCGVGTLALFAADHARHVFGVECVPSAIENAIENATLNEVSNCTFTCGFVEKMIESFDTDVVFLNPPRKGCASSLLDALLNKRPKKIVYISCDPGTLARDLSHLAVSYQLSGIQPFDMFPQTMHVETVVKLELKSIHV
ncbi:MAG: 23S rRNA (uracil(1939)-C(5))-methyltransferase RlmD [Chlamydiales bacterium]|nr:23S rRNA (uracil(1939)-C(5))-methyltransferase RlmD [Chlamydiales bacterium]